jgi:hypothetical protein
VKALDDNASPRRAEGARAEGAETPSSDPSRLVEPLHAVLALTVDSGGFVRARHRFYVPETPDEPEGRTVVVATSSILRSSTRIVTVAGAVPGLGDGTSRVRFEGGGPHSGAVLLDPRGHVVARAASTSDPSQPVAIDREERLFLLSPMGAWWRGATLADGRDSTPVAQTRPSTLTGRRSSLAFYRDPDPVLGAFVFLLARRRWGFGESRLDAAEGRLLSKAHPRRV